jgi:hypothetical protein
MNFFEPGVTTVEYRQPNRREDKEHARLRRRLYTAVQVAALRTWQELPPATQHVLLRRTMTAFTSLCELVDAKTQDRAFRRLRVLRETGAKPVNMVRMRPENMGPTPYVDGRLAPLETVLEIFQRTLHRYVNNKVQREMMFADAETARHDARPGQDDERLVRCFLHVSQRAYWPPSALMRALAYVEEAREAVNAHIRALS